MNEPSVTYTSNHVPMSRVDLAVVGFLHLSNHATAKPPLPKSNKSSILNITTLEVLVW